MKNRIRQFRKQNGLTLKALGERIGTTPQTVQRLETSNMTVSTDWLEKIAAVFGIEPATLLGAQTTGRVPILGRLGGSGTLDPTATSEEGAEISIEVPAQDAIAVALREDIGPYPRGSILIGERLRGRAMDNAVGRDAIALLPDGTMHLCRVIRGTGASFTLVSAQPGGDVHRDVSPVWVARLVMRLQYL